MQRKPVSMERNNITVKFQQIKLMIKGWLEGVV